MAKYSAAVSVSAALGALAPLCAAATAQADNGCITGYVPRLASPSDLVCVTPAVAQRTQQENAAASQYWVSGAYGPQTCVSGRVWREAFDGDVVCVTPDIRDQTWADNAAAESRRAPVEPPAEEPEEEQAEGAGGGGANDDWGPDPCAQTKWEEAFGDKDYNTALCEPEMQAPEEPAG
jgi:hypothetical protein